MWNEKQQKVIDGLGKGEVVQLRFTSGRYGLPLISKNGIVSPCGENTNQGLSNVGINEETKTTPTPSGDRDKKTKVMAGEKTKVMNRKTKVINEEYPEKTKVMEPKTKVMDDNSQKTKVKLLMLILDNRKITTKELVNGSGLSQSGVEWNLRELKESGKINRVGSARTGSWGVVL